VLSGWRRNAGRAFTLQLSQELLHFDANFLPPSHKAQHALTTETPLH
jgi:hypothetical protein